MHIGIGFDIASPVHAAQHACRGSPPPVHPTHTALRISHGNSQLEHCKHTKPGLMTECKQPSLLANLRCCAHHERCPPKRPGLCAIHAGCGGACGPVFATHSLQQGHEASSAGSDQQPAAFQALMVIGRVQQALDVGRSCHALLLSSYRVSHVAPRQTNSIYYVMFKFAGAALFGPWPTLGQQVAAPGLWQGFRPLVTGPEIVHYICNHEIVLADWA